MSHFKSPKVRDGYKLVYRRWIRNPKTGKRIYPKKAKCFRFWVKLTA